MTGSQDISCAPLPSSHSPASTSSVSSAGSYGGYSGSCTSSHPAPPPSRGHPPAPGSYPLPVTGYVTSQQPPSSDQTDGGMASNGGGLCTYPAPVLSGDKLGHETAHMTGPPGFMGWPEGEGLPPGPHYPAYPGYEAAPAPGYPPVVINPAANGGCEPGAPGHGVTVTTVTGDSGPASSRGQHTVHFHVHQGEAVSLQLGTEVQMIQGPATVRMVSTSHEPPVPLPVQVPPGHFVHQLVDENGILQHVILSQHPTPGLYPSPAIPPHGPAQPPNGTSQNGWQPGAGGQGYVEPTGVPPPTIQCTGPPPAFWNSNESRETQPPRPGKNKNKNRDYNNRYGKGKPSGSSSPSLSVQSTPPQSPVKPRGNAYNGRSSGGWKGSSATVDDSDESGIGVTGDEDQEEKQLLLEILSNIRTPGVPEIRARNALLCWAPPTMEPGDTAKFEGVKPIQDTDLEYEVLMSDKGRDGKYRSIFSGASKDCYLTDLRPHTEYHIRVHAVLKSMNLKGGASDTVSFVTLACEPDQPAAPKLVTRSKTSIQLKWNNPGDNGAHIQHFILESDEGTTATSPVTGHFSTIFEGRSKSFNVQKLQPSTPYKFRLIAVNELGR